MITGRVAQANSRTLTTTVQKGKTYLILSAYSGSYSYDSAPLYTFTGATRISVGNIHGNTSLFADFVQATSTTLEITSTGGQTSLGVLSVN